MTDNGAVAELSFYLKTNKSTFHNIFTCPLSYLFLPAPRKLQNFQIALQFVVSVVMRAWPFQVQAGAWVIVSLEFFRLFQPIFITIL